MRFRVAPCLIVALLFAWTAIAEQTAAKNIIVMIADGWGYNHVLATDYFVDGEAGKQLYEREFKLYGMSTFLNGGSYDPKQGSNYEYLKKGATDSAAAATAMSSGIKTYDGAIGVGPNQKPVEHAAQHAEKVGKSSGVITTVPLSHATPAGFSAHQSKRSSYDEIALEMIENSGLDVIMGAGNPEFDENGKPIDKKTLAESSNDASFRYVSGREEWNKLLKGEAGGDADGDGKPDHWTLIQTKEEFQNLAAGKGALPKRLIGVAQDRTTLQQERKSIDNDAKGDGPFQTPLLDNQPTLADMTLGALNVLGQNPKGFYLMIEGGAVDWANHDNQLGRMIEEMIDYNKAVEAVAKWVEAHGGWDQTLVIVTGDHECGYLLGPGSNPELKPIVNNGKGKMPGAVFNTKDHTNSLIPCFVRGAGASLFEQYIVGTDPQRGQYIDDTTLAKVSFTLMR